MANTIGLGRVAVLGRGEQARRAVRAVRELARAGQAGIAVAVHAPGDRGARFAREADESVEVGGPFDEALRACHPDSAWLGPASIAEHAAFAEACARAGVRHLGPPVAALRQLSKPEGIATLAADVGIPLAPATPDPRWRLVEVVVACDARGGERAIGIGEASLQRGGLAVLVESPSTALSASSDRDARNLAARACAATGWVGVCSVSLLVDARTRRWFLAGLHPFAQSAPAIEALAGVDLVRLALRLAAAAPIEAGEAPTRGHAFGARLLSQDPESEPAAAPGPVEILRLPSGLGVRADAAVAEGDEAPSDGVLAVLVARGESRMEALARLEQALADSDVLLRSSGSNRAWLSALCERLEVREEATGIGVLEALAASRQRLVSPRPEAALIAAAIDAYDGQLRLERSRFIAEARRGRPRVGPSSGRVVELRYGGERHRIEVRQTWRDTYRVAAGGAPAEVRVERLGQMERRLAWGNHRARAFIAVDGMRMLVMIDGIAHPIVRDPSGVVVSPMPAVVAAIPVEPGQSVAAGEPIARIESMKVEVEVRAPLAGVVREVLAAVNGQVDAGAPLVRIDPAGDPPVAAEPLVLGSGTAPEAASPRERYQGMLADLRRLSLGFDVSGADAKRLAARFRELSAAAPPDDPDVLLAEDGALRAFADLESLYDRTARRGGKPPLEELWRYLHGPEQRGDGLTPAFIELLRHALSHYAVSLDAPQDALELALLRIQKAHERAGEQLAPVIAILDRRLAGDGPPAGLSGADARAVLDRLVEVGQERFPALADLAREARYRRFDQPALERARAEARAQAEADVARLAAAEGDERRVAMERLVELPHTIGAFLVSRMAAAEPRLGAALVETLLRRYYRVRPLGRITSGDVEGGPCASADYERGGQLYRVAATFAEQRDTAAALRRLARLAADVPPERELLVEIYLWGEAARGSPDENAEQLRVALGQAGFPGPLRRASVVLATPGHAGATPAQQHFTFRGGPGDWSEDHRYRGVHPMLAERMQLERLSRFELERVPSVEDVYLFRATARGNPKDERLFAMAEVRDATAVPDGAGGVHLPQLERMFHEALAGMRLFQAHRAPGQRLEWNRVMLTVTPPLLLSREEVRRLAERLAPEIEGLGLEVALMDARMPDPATGELRETLVRVITRGQSVAIRFDEPTDRPLEPMAEYQQKVVQLRRRGLTHPFELLRVLAPAEVQAGIPRGEFVEHDLDASGALVPVQRPPGSNTANVVVGVVRSFTDRHPEGMQRVIVLGDPGREMGSVAEPECRRIYAALELAERLGAPLEWFEVCAGAKISMTSGTENMDWVSAVLRKIIEFTQRGGEINVVVLGITVGAQPYWNAEATMLMHTRGILVMAPGSSMVLTGKQALEYSGSVSAEDNEGIGGYDRIMGPNGQAQYQAQSVPEACQILMRHYDHAYVAPGERFPRRAASSDPRDRDVRSSPHGADGGAGFETVGDVFSAEKNPDRKKPFEIRRVMASVIDADHAPLERWRDLRGGDTGVVWDAHLGGWPVCLVGIQSRPLPRLEFVPADGPEFWSAGTLFPQSSKKIARAVNSASGNRPLVVLANLSGFDGSPESMRRLQLEYGAEIGRAVVNFRGPIVFCVVSRYHGGAFVVFAKTLREDIEVVAVEGARASVIGGAPAAAVVFAREVETRTRKDPRVAAAERAAAQGGTARAHLQDVIALVRSEKLGEVGGEFDAIHSVERALKVGSLDRIIAARDLRPYLIDAVERGMAGKLGEGRSR